jgi:hypothetical protein
MNYDLEYETLFGVSPKAEAGVDDSTQYNNMYPLDQLGMSILNPKAEVEWLVSHSTTTDDGARCWSF